MSANQKTNPESGKRLRAKSTVSIRLDDLIALKDVKGGSGSVVFGELGALPPVPKSTRAPKPGRKRGLS